MPDKVITSIDQVTTAWLTSVLTNSGALINGAVAMFDVKAGRGNWSTNATLNVKYVNGSQGALPQRLFLKMVNAHLEDGFFSPSEVHYYTRDFIGVEGVPLVRCYSAVFSGELQRYHVLLDDLSESHIEAEEKTPTIEYGLALAEGLAVMHARWWGAQRFKKGERQCTVPSIFGVLLTFQSLASRPSSITSHPNWNHTGRMPFVRCMPDTRKPSSSEPRMIAGSHWFTGM